MSDQTQIQAYTFRVPFDATSDEIEAVRRSLGDLVKASFGCCEYLLAECHRDHDEWKASVVRGARDAEAAVFGD